MDFSNMFGQLKEVQEKLKQAQEDLVNVTAEGDAGGGMVRAVANGKKQVIKLEIDPLLCKEEDREMLQDLVVAAVNQAIKEADQKGQERLMKTTKGMMPNIPGMDFGNLG
ncbi:MULTISPECIES: YbaB/EbfC family nucleoid-associated protein [unclassified Flammeovirga]|uniref:YbaB/EbfC family nucleoid-associated protein n=1 Tax=unclassified Flammeovirga TaxID=2637820 RepID=UPI0005C53934|nr:MULTISPECIES: YbaB/EbfC family nucleoid-associated protein [unclassified Flammeovirga]MBD0404092.1 YbaB/EbfC family nucleoid-associated protein [Flammeovirga sp. EKP202]